MRESVSVSIAALKRCATQNHAALFPDTQNYAAPFPILFPARDEGVSFQIRSIPISNRFKSVQDAR
jgi:hypothetical protein